MARTVLLLGAAREQSTRCQDKMMRPFGGTTLFDVYTQRLRDLNATGLFASWGVAVARRDERMWARASESSIPVIERSARSVSPEIQPRGRELHFLDQFDTDCVCYLNACLPFFPLDWIRVAIENYLVDDGITSMAPVVELNNWFWWPNGSPINNRDPECLSTQGAPRVLASVHAFFLYPRARMLRRNLRWTSAPGDPSLLGVKDIGPALMDVDSEEDFKRCEQEWIRAREGDAP